MEDNAHKYASKQPGSGVCLPRIRGNRCQNIVYANINNGQWIEMGKINHHVNMISETTNRYAKLLFELL